MSRSRYGFTGGAGWRTGAVVLYAMIACIAIVLVEKNADHTEARPEATAQEKRGAVRIEIETTFEASNWSVTLGGIPIEPAATTKSSWQAIIDAPSKLDELLVEAENSDYFSEQSESMRILVFEGERQILEKAWWGKGTATMLVKL